jgi:hypothetical protein
MALAGKICECGCWVTLHLDDDTPSSWAIYDPKQLLADDELEGWEFDWGSNSGHVTEDALGKAVQAALASRAAFEPTITCACGHTYRALTQRPWIEED